MMRIAILVLLVFAGAGDLDDIAAYLNRSHYRFRE
jgi:hypothetical protein